MVAFNVISLFREIILQQVDELKIEIQCTLTKLCARLVGSLLKSCKMSPGAENVEYLNSR